MGILAAHGDPAAAMRLIDFLRVPNPGVCGIHLGIRLARVCSRSLVAFLVATPVRCKGPLQKIP